MHLSNTYGDKAFRVAELAKITGQRWPIAGKKIHREFPYIEAEVSGSILFNPLHMAKPFRDGRSSGYR